MGYWDSNREEMRVKEKLIWAKGKQVKVMEDWEHTE